jgi:N-acetylmuramoyl-L-alanine amidase
LIKLYIDPGHGGTDSGAVGHGLYEKNLNLAISKKIEALLKDNYENVEVKMSRTGDTYPSLTARTNEANEWGADCFVSVHINANANASARGFSTYIYPNAGTETVSFQNVMHQEIFKQVKHLNVTDIGKKSADFHVLRESNMNAILTENFFISNSADAAQLKNEEFLNLLAYGHVVGLQKFYGLKLKPSPPLSNTIYRVVVGSFSSRENAERQQAKLKKDGYDSFIEVKQ